MKKSIFSLTLISLCVSSFAMTPVMPVAPTGTITGAITSQATGNTSSFAVTTLPGQTSYHSSSATAKNCVTAGAVSLPGMQAANAQTSTVTNGNTYVFANGSGPGGTLATAAQFGSGTVTATANVTPVVGVSGLSGSGVVSATSTVNTGTVSSVSTVDTGYASASTAAGAMNTSNAMTYATVDFSSVSVFTSGNTLGNTWATSTGVVSPTNAVVTTVGTLVVNSDTATPVSASQNGVFNAQVSGNAVINTSGYYVSPVCIGECATKPVEITPGTPAAPAAPVVIGVVE